MSQLELLLIEDNPSDADFIIDRLEHISSKGKYAKQELHTTWAATLKEGLEKAKQLDVSLVLLDLNLPDSHGLDTLNKVLAAIEAPVVVLTGDISNNLWMDAMHAGAQDYLTKNDIEEEVLLRTIGHALERSKLRQELKKSNKDLEQFAYAASHDLQEPLRTMRSFAERIKDRNWDKLDEQSRDYLARIEKAGLRMQTLLDDLLEYSRLSSHNQEYSSVDMNKVFNEIVLDLEAKIRITASSIFIFSATKTIELCNKGKINAKFLAQCNILPIIEANATQVRRLFENIISNSIKYSKQGISPVINIRSSCDPGNLWQVAIEDNGIGFEEEYKEKIFQQFQRLHGVGEYEGTGMGLATVRKIAESYGGAVEASSKLGLGSCFSVKLPLKQRLAAKAV